jgi:hypothetical protein
MKWMANDRIQQVSGLDVPGGLDQFRGVGARFAFPIDIQRNIGPGRTLAVTVTVTLAPTPILILLTLIGVIM